MHREDVEEAKATGSSLLYGEVLPEGVCKLLDSNHADAANARVLVDLGMGTGKLCLQGVCREHAHDRLASGAQCAAPRCACCGGVSSSYLCAVGRDCTVVWPRDSRMPHFP